MEKCKSIDKAPLYMLYHLCFSKQKNGTAQDAQGILETIGNWLDK